MSERISFFDRTKQFHRWMPRSWSAITKHVAAVLFTYAGRDDGGGISCSVRTLSIQAGEPERAIQRVQAFLREGGFLVDEGHMTIRPGHTIPLRRLVLEAMREARSKEDAQGTAPDSGDTPGDTVDTGGVSGLSRGGGVSGGTQTESKKDNRKDSCPHEVPRGDHQPGLLFQEQLPTKGIEPEKNADPIGFNAFYAAYPRKVGRANAEKAWDKAIKAGVDPGRILSGLQWQLPKLNETDPEFRPHPATWLNAGRYDDERPEDANGHTSPLLNPASWPAGVSKEAETGRPLVNGFYIAETAEDACEAAGLPMSEAPRQWRPIIPWLEADIPPGTIREAIRRVASRADYRPPATLKFFDRAVREHRGTR